MSILAPTSTHELQMKMATTTKSANKALQWMPYTPPILRNVLRTFYCAKPAPFRSPLNLALGVTHELL